MSDPVKKLFFDNIRHGRAFEVSPLLRDHPEINVNCVDDESTPLQAASLFDSVEIVKLLLAHPNIDVNLKDIFGRPPISYGCYGGFVSVVQVLLKDPRVDVTLDDNNGCTPLVGIQLWVP